MSPSTHNRASASARTGRFVQHVTDTLQADGVHTDAAHVEKALTAAVDATVPLTEDESAFFAAHSGLPEGSAVPVLEDVYGDAASHPDSGITITRRAPMMTSREVADFLGLTRTAVTRRTAKHLLHAITRDGTMLFPAWQFTDSHDALPHLDKVLPHLPPEWGTHRAAQFFTTPTDLLDGNSPAQWLAHDGHPDTLITVMRDEARE